MQSPKSEDVPEASTYKDCIHIPNILVFFVTFLNFPIKKNEFYKEFDSRFPSLFYT